MAASEGYSHTFSWPHAEPQSVVVTGTFDNWSRLQRDADNTFSATVSLPYGQTVLYKYVVDGSWVTHHEQPTQDDGSGNVNNVFKVPEKQEDANVIAAVSAAAGAAVAGAGVALAAASSAFSNVLGTSSAPEPAPVSATAGTTDSLPVNDTAVCDAPNAVPSSEKPPEPAPSPSAGKQQSLPTVPSGEDVQSALDKSSTPTAQTSAADTGALAPLAPLAVKEDAKVAAAHPPAGTSVQASGEGASTANGSDNFLRLTEATAGAAAVGAVGTAVAAGAGAGTASSAKTLEPVKGVEVYGKDGGIGKDAKIAVAKVEHESKSAAPETKTPAPPNKEQSSLPAPVAAVASKVAPKSSKEPTKPAQSDVFSDDKKDKANGKSYAGLGHSKDASKASTVSKASTTGAAAPSSAANTPAKEEYKTAPTTPATPIDGKKGGDRQRTSSFFTKVKSALSPSKSKKAAN